VRGRTLIIKWGINENILFNYLIVSDNEVIKDGFVLSNINEYKALKILSKLIERNRIEMLIVENNAFLNSLRVAIDGHDAPESLQWVKKLRLIDRIYQNIISGQMNVPFQVKDINSEREKLKCNHGKFIALESNGTVRFEREKVKLPKSLINFSAYIYESFIVNGISFIRPVEQFVKLEGGKIKLQLDGKREIVLNADIDRDSKYVVVWIRKKEDGPDAIISSGKTQAQALCRHRRAVIGEMVNWVNKTKNIEFVLGLSRVSHAQAAEYALKFMKGGFHST